MIIASIAGAGLAALVAAGTASAATASEAKLHSPLLAPWTGPYGGVPPFDKVKVEDFKPALEAAMAEALAEIDAIASDPAPPDLREHDRRARGRRPHARPRAATIFGDLQLDDEHAGLPGGRARDGAEARRVRRRDHAEREALRAHRGGLRRAREGASSRPSSSASSGSTTPTSCARARKLDARGQEAPVARSTSASRRSSRVQPERARRRGRATCSSSTSEADLAGPAASRCAPAPRPPPRRAARRASGRSPTRARRWSRSSPTRRGATCARRCGGCSSAAATTATRTTTTTIITEILALRAERAKLLGYPDARALAPRERDGEDARARDGADGGGLEAGGRARARGGRRHAGDRRQGRREAQDRAVGLPLLRREGAQGEVRPRPERGQAVPAAREAARGRCSGSRASSSASSSRRSPACRSTTPTCSVWR